MSGWFGAWSALLSSLTLPQGAGPGQARIVISGADLPPPLDTYLVADTAPYVAAILFYSDSASGDDFTYIGLCELGTLLVVHIGSVSNGNVVETANFTPGAIGLELNPANNHTKTQLYTNLVDPGNSAWNAIYALSPGATNDEHDVWNGGGFLLINGWAGSLKYRKMASPAECVQVKGMALIPGVKANGTTIAVIPAQWRPVTAQDIPASCNNVVAGGESPHFNIQPDGRVICYGFTAATFGSCSGDYSLDITP